MEKIAKNPKKIEKTASVRGLEEEFIPGSFKWGADKPLFSASKDGDINTLYETVKHSPECIACIMAIVEDIMADFWRFFSVVKAGKSQSAMDNAEEFQSKSRFKKVLTNAIIDLLITGNAYILKLSIDADKLKFIMDKLTEKIAKKFAVKIKKDAIYEFIDQEVKKPKDIQLLKSSTVRLNFDETGLLKSYEQRVHGISRIYKPSDIIHLSLMNIGGQPYGFTPLETLLSDIATLIFAKEYAGKYFENDGIPTFLFKLPKEHPNSPNYHKIKSELIELKKQTHKWKSMVLTGELEVDQIQKFNKDMEYSKLIQHFTQIILMAYGVPAKRINLTIDIRQIGSDPKASEGYYKKISFMQMLLSEDLNRELWIPYFKVRMEFKESYKIDEMREAQIVQIVSQAGIITQEEAREMIGLDPEMPKGTPIKSVGDQSAINMTQDKKNEAGQEKPQDIPLDNKLKIAKSTDDALKISYIDFFKIVENRIGIGNFSKANVLYLETLTEFILYFHDGNWKYQTNLEKSKIIELTGLDVDTFRFERLRNAVKLFI